AYRKTGQKRFPCIEKEASDNNDRGKSFRQFRVFSHDDLPGYIYQSVYRIFYILKTTAAIDHCRDFHADLDKEGRSPALYWFAECSRMSPGWQFRTSQIAFSVSNRMPFILPVLRLLKLTLLI